MPKTEEDSSEFDTPSSLKLGNTENPGTESRFDGSTAQSSSKIPHNESLDPPTEQQTYLSGMPGNTQGKDPAGTHGQIETFPGGPPQVNVDNVPGLKVSGMDKMLQFTAEVPEESCHRLQCSQSDKVVQEILLYNCNLWIHISGVLRKTKVQFVSRGVQCKTLHCQCRELLILEYGFRPKETLHPKGLQFIKQLHIPVCYIQWRIH